MSNHILRFVFVTAVAFISCKKAQTPSSPPPKPLIQLKVSLAKVQPFTYSFYVITDSGRSGYKFHWDFGDGTVKDGRSTEQYSYPDNRIFHVTVTVTQNNSDPAVASADINTSIALITADTSRKFQTMDGFGGFGGQSEWWSGGPYTSPAFINSLVNDLGVTIVRDEIPTNFEIVNDNSDPYNTDLSRYNLDSGVVGQHPPLRTHFQFLKDVHAAGVSKFITAVWSPPAWMKTNNRINNGGSPNAPGYSDTPDSTNNQLKRTDYEEFAEMLVAYVRIVKQQTGIDIYAINVQNEPRFSQPFESCVYNGPAFRDLVKTVGERFRYEGLSTRIFAPEDIGYLDGVSGMVQPILTDPTANSYTDIIAVHGYALDGATPNSPDALTWQTMYSWGAQYGKPLWMTETSGYPDDWSGAMALSKAIFTALKQGNVSAWLFWTISTSNLDSYSLMNSSGAKSKRYYVSKNFYRYIRPGAVRFSAETASDTAKIYVLAFNNAALHSTSLVLINDNVQDRAIKLSGAGLPPSFEMYVSSAAASSNCSDNGVVNTADNLLLPAGSVVTLVSK